MRTGFVTFGFFSLTVITVVMYKIHLFLIYSQLPTVLDRNSPGADLKTWGRVLSNVSQVMQKVSGLIICR